MPKIATEDEEGWVTPEEGRAEAVTSETPRKHVAVLWVPDPEQRHGWREYWVDKEKPGVRPLGLGRRR
jgi:hypothetical protein